ncbi:hypothetical protein HU200_022085 [Digitaria exilis]|uniref:Protein kinase domain-containing protein n=1 Tax=Digitaria exilis TaxID=1010633 RepID=A0A835C200_9POAL|nr:hypothetical protein HU200_022085 [Digitaria exilis]
MYPSYPQPSPRFLAPGHLNLSLSNPSHFSRPPKQVTNQTDRDRQRRKTKTWTPSRSTPPPPRARADTHPITSPSFPSIDSSPATPQRNPIVSISRADSGEPATASSSHLCGGGDQVGDRTEKEIGVNAMDSDCEDGEGWSGGWRGGLKKRSLLWLPNRLPGRDVVAALSGLSRGGVSKQQTKQQKRHALLPVRELGAGGRRAAARAVDNDDDGAVAFRAVQQQHSDCCGSSLNASELSSAGSFSRCRQLSSSSQRPHKALRVFTFQELSRAHMLGEGGFGCVYRGTVRGAAVDEPRRSVVDVAIKQLGRKGLQGHKEWMTEVNVLGVVDHANLVKLIGYCAEDDERGMQLLLVYEFMPNGSLADHLSARSPRVASWGMRLRVALDTARGLKYLHEDTKNDIWSFGVVLYELLTGRRPVDRNRPRGEQNLVDWVKPYSSDAKKLETVIDPRLQGNYSIKSAAQLASVANKCLVRHARYRPKMSEVLEMVQKIHRSIP